MIVDDDDGFDDHGTNGDDDYKQEEAIGENGGLKSSVSHLRRRWSKKSVLGLSQSTRYRFGQIWLRCSFARRRNIETSGDPFRKQQDRDQARAIIGELAVSVVREFV